MRTTALLLAAAFALTACHRDMSSTTYTDGASAGKVLEGTVVSARAVTVKEHDKLQDNTLGGLAGGASGAVAGSSVGHGNGSIAGGIGGAIVGAVAGAYIQDALSTSDGMEYLVKLDAKYLDAEGKNHKLIKEKGSNLVQDEITSSINTDTKTDILSIVQSPDQPIAVGTRVYVIYSNDRPRLTPIPANVK